MLSDQCRKINSSWDTSDALVGNRVGNDKACVIPGCAIFYHTSNHSISVASNISSYKKSVNVSTPHITSINIISSAQLPTSQRQYLKWDSNTNISNNGLWLLGAKRELTHRQLVRLTVPDTYKLVTDLGRLCGCDFEPYSDPCFYQLENYTS